MTDHGQITARRSAPSSARLEEAINHLSLGIVIFDEKREVVFCNERYREMYGLSPEQVKPGTPTSELIRHRLGLGLKAYRAYTAVVQAENFIRTTGGNWFMVVDVEGYVAASRTSIRAAIQRLLYINVLESEKEGRYTKYRLKESYLERQRSKEAAYN